MSNATVREIVIAHLKSVGADGLCSEECGCGIDDLAPCGGDFSECKPAKRHACDGSCGCFWNSVIGGDCYRQIDLTEEKGK